MDTKFDTNSQRTCTRVIDSSRKRARNVTAERPTHCADGRNGCPGPLATLTEQPNYSHEIRIFWGKPDFVNHEIPKSKKKKKHVYSNILLHYRTRDRQKRPYRRRPLSKQAQKWPDTCPDTNPPKTSVPSAPTQKQALGHARTRNRPKASVPSAPTLNHVPGHAEDHDHEIPKSGSHFARDPDKT